MVFLGVGLILYGTYAVVVGVWYRMFPTEPPSRVEAMRQSLGLEQRENQMKGTMSGWTAKFKNWRAKRQGTPAAVRRV